MGTRGCRSVKDKPEKKDPTRAEIEAMCAEIRKEWVSRKRLKEFDAYIPSMRETRRHRLRIDKGGFDTN